MPEPCRNRTTGKAATGGTYDGAPRRANVPLICCMCRSADPVWLQNLQRRCSRYGKWRHGPSGRWRLSGSGQQRPPVSGFSSKHSISNQARCPLGRAIKSSNRPEKSTWPWSMGPCGILIDGGLRKFKGKDGCARLAEKRRDRARLDRRL
jgi:hypothetical protein